MTPHTETALEIWFEFGSTYSYLSVMRIESLARRHGVPLAWKPFLLGPIFRDLGWSTSPFVLQPEKGRYMWVDLARQAERHGLPWRKPSVFPRRAVLPMRVAALAADESWVGTFCRRVMLQNFVDDLDIDAADNVLAALADLVPSPTATLATAQDEANKHRLRAMTAEARSRGVFGAPTFFVGEDMFWGDDRLDDAMALAAGRRGADG